MTDTGNARRGVLLALAGVLVLTPDALLLRLSGMGGLQMLGWRGLCMGGLFLAIWAVTSPARRAEAAALLSGTGLVVVASYAVNAALFPIGIALAPVTPVLLGVATVPLWSALLAWALYGERTSTRTWIATGAVFVGIVLAVSDHGAQLDRAAALGALCGIGVALGLAMTFVTLRFAPHLPLLATLGCGALVSGSLGWAVTGPGAMMQGTLWPILLTSVLVLPVAFLLISSASRHIPATLVSLILLLETVLGPLWVWLGIGEAPGPRMLAGGAVVLGTLALYLFRPER